MKLITSKDFKKRQTGSSIYSQRAPIFLEAVIITLRKKTTCEASFETEMLILNNRLVKEEQEELLARFEFEKICHNIKKHKL